MKKILIENLGMSNPAEFDFSLGNPLFLCSENELRIIIHDGTSYASVVVDLPGVGNCSCIEQLHPTYPEGVPEGAAYNLFADEDYHIVVCEDGVYVWSAEKEPDYYSYDDCFDTVDEMANAINVDALTLNAMFIG